MTCSWWDRQNNGFDEFLQRGSHISLTQCNNTATLKMEAIAAVRYLAIGKISCGLSHERSDYTTKYIPFNSLTLSRTSLYFRWKCTPCTLIKRCHAPRSEMWYLFLFWVIFTLNLCLLFHVLFGFQCVYCFPFDFHVPYYLETSVLYFSSCLFPLVFWLVFVFSWPSVHVFLCQGYVC